MLVTHSCCGSKASCPVWCAALPAVAKPWSCWASGRAGYLERARCLLVVSVCVCGSRSLVPSAWAGQGLSHLQLPCLPEVQPDKAGTVWPPIPLNQGWR